MNLFSDHLRGFLANSGDVREFLRQPLRHNNTAILTNGAIALRIHAVDKSQLDPLGKWPFNDFPAKIDSAAQLLGATLAPLPELPIAISCAFCHGSGLDKPCPKCNDISSWSCGHCAGAGVIPAVAGEEDVSACFFCDGTGHERQEIDIGPGTYDSRLLALITSLSGAVFAPDDEDNAAYFRCDIGDGLLMPMRKAP